jgi:poly(A) polymerase
LAKNFDFFEMKLAKKNLQFLQNFSRPDFPINGEDLKCLGLNGAEIGEAIKQAKIFWANGDFEADKFALMNLLQNHGSCG